MWLHKQKLWLKIWCLGNVGNYMQKVLQWKKGWIKLLKLCLHWTFFGTTHWEDCYFPILSPVKTTRETFLSVTLPSPIVTFTHQPLPIKSYRVNFSETISPLWTVQVSKVARESCTGGLGHQVIKHRQIIHSHSFSMARVSPMTPLHFPHTIHRKQVHILVTQ